VTARIVHLHGDEHEAVQSLLPWYLTNTLDEAELARVQAHLRDCAECQADAAWQERLRAGDGLRTEPAPEHRVDHDWAALTRRIAADASRPRRSPSQPSWRASSWWPFAFAVQSALVALVVLVWFVEPLREQPSYHALGAAPAASSANVLVVFRPNATEADIRLALRASRAQLVGGPTVTDAYLLRMEPLTSEALAKLRGQGVVLRVDSLEGMAR
jgi:anti-sigma-K factor RskA